LIVAYRWLGPLLTKGKDSTWLDHSVDCHERMEMREAWESWDKTFNGRQCMPNWDICLLHPEDCNLRLEWRSKASNDSNDLALRDTLRSVGTLIDSYKSKRA